MKKLTPENLFQNKSLKSTLEKLKGYSEESSEEVPTVAEIGAQFGLDTESIDNLTKDFSLIHQLLMTLTINMILIVEWIYEQI